jgi:hypothetical protein
MVGDYLKSGAFNTTRKYILPRERMYQSKDVAIEVANIDVGAMSKNISCQVLVLHHCKAKSGLAISFTKL